MRLHNLDPSGFDGLMPKTVASAKPPHTHVCLTTRQGVQLRRATTAKEAKPLALTSTAELVAAARDIDGRHRAFSWPRPPRSSRAVDTAGVWAVHSPRCPGAGDAVRHRRLPPHCFGLARGGPASKGVRWPPDGGRTAPAAPEGQRPPAATPDASLNASPAEADTDNCRRLATWPPFDRNGLAASDGSEHQGSTPEVVRSVHRKATVERPQLPSRRQENRRNRAQTAPTGQPGRRRPPPAPDPHRRRHSSCAT